MSAPRHLWSGDWQNESSALGEDLAARRARTGESGEAEPVPAPQRPRRSAAARLRAWLRAIRRSARLRPRRRYAGSRRGRIVVLVGLLALVGAGTAYAVTSALTGSGGRNQAAASGYQPWIGIDLYNSPFGGPIVVSVAPGSPAQAAGMQPGDVISQVDGQPVATTSEFASAIAGKHPGDQVTIQLERGPATYVADVTLATRPVGYP
ncbi:MAG TPA: PDZ domain-containing protein [Solirubrobacteraceae bacterium]|nr:PDZ domain-containing protein [Solirubrobacteraceae bacterium]